MTLAKPAAGHLDLHVVLRTRLEADDSSQPTCTTITISDESQGDMTLFKIDDYIIRIGTNPDDKLVVELAMAGFGPSVIWRAICALEDLSSAAFAAVRASYSYLRLDATSVLRGLGLQ